jgi:hypothetical protein
VIQAGQAQLEKPAAWNVNLAQNGLLFKSHKYLLVDGKLVQPIGGAAIHDPITNEWLIKHELDLLSNIVKDEDPDKDGFSNLDEYLGVDRSAANGDADSTDPREAKSHPPYHTKLFVKEYIRVRFRILFNAYDGDPQKPESMSFQINTLDLRGSTMFLSLGDMVTNTKFKLDSFAYKTSKNPSTDVEEDVSELTLLNTETNEKITLVVTRATDSPDSFALFQYRWPQPAQDIRVKKNGEFVLKPNVTERYKLIDIKETEAVIQLPSGEKYTVPRAPQ